MSDAVTMLVQLVPSIAKLATGLTSAADAAKRNAQLIEFQNSLIGLQSLIASVQQENATMARQKGDLEEELKRMKDWGAQSRRYKLAAPFAGCMVYALQKAMSEGEPPHYLCASCFQKGQPSILQGREGKPRKEGGRIHSSYFCQACGAEAFSGWMNIVPPNYLEDIKPQT